jgi:hypothetical protein
MPKTEEQKKKGRENAREWYRKNKEKKLNYQNEYYEKNKTVRQDKQKEYAKTDAGKKSVIIASWKKMGIIHTDYGELYEKYMLSTNCDNCGVIYGMRGSGGNFKCCDHDHYTGLFRNFLCNSCNLKRR